MKFSEDGEIKTICTLPQFKAQNICRSCDNSRYWRCDSGWCIDIKKRRNGIADCPNDSSDEEFSKLTFSAVISIIYDCCYLYYIRKLVSKSKKTSFIFQLT